MTPIPTTMLRHSSAIASTLLAASVLTASDGIVYSGIQNIPVTQGGSKLWLDVETGATTTNPGATTNWDLGFDPFPGGTLDTQTSIDLDTFVVGGGSTVQPLPAGAVISASNADTTGTALSLDEFVGTTAFIGFIFQDSNSFTFSGWLRLGIDGSLPEGGSMTIVDWAYKIGLEDSIEAGAVPEPASTALLTAAALLGAAALRRRRGR